MQTFHQSIGILGGIGPAATVRLHERIIAGAQGLYGAIEDDEYPEVLSISLAGSYLSHTGVRRFKHHSLMVAIQQGIQRLERAGANILVIPCNTIHQPRILQGLKAAASSQLITIIDAVVDEVVSKGVTKVGVIASEDSVKHGIYDKVLKQRGLRPLNITSYDQHKVNQIIHRAMGGRLLQRDVDVIERIQRDLVRRGAEATILGCTELSLLYDELSHDACLIDSVEVMAKTVLQMATERKKHESLQLTIE